MDARTERNKAYLRDLFSGPFPGHAIAVQGPAPRIPEPGADVTVSERPVSEWVDWAVRRYEADRAWSERFGDDMVPYGRIQTGTQIFAVALGCPVHIYGDTPPCALPLIRDLEELARVPEPSLDNPVFEKLFAMTDGVAQRLGPEVPVGGVDIQSPFDIAALICNKEDFFVGIYEEPQAVRELVERCQVLLEMFFDEFLRRYPQVNLNHFPYAWSPPELGCWLSEDECGSLSEETFVEFVLPSLERLSRKYGGIFMHCCAYANHQHPNFLRIPNLRGLNRGFGETGPAPLVETFSGQTTIVHTGPVEQFHELLDIARPETRYFFSMPPLPEDEMQREVERLRAHCEKAASIGAA